MDCKYKKVVKNIPDSFMPDTPRESSRKWVFSRAGKSGEPWNQVPGKYIPVAVNFHILKRGRGRGQDFFSIEAEASDAEATSLFRSWPYKISDITL